MSRPGRLRRWTARCGLGALVVAALVAASCSDDRTAAPDPTAPPPPPATPIAATDQTALDGLGIDGRCDELDATRCLLPFPSDRYTEPDPGTPTGVRVELPGGQLANTSGVTLQVEPWRSLDGFSPGTPMLTLLGDVDLTASGAPPIGDIARSLDPGSATVVVDLTTGERLAHWAELDARAPAGQQLLIIRAAAPLPEGHRIGVAVRNLVDRSGRPVEPGVAFRAYRDALSTSTPAVEERRGRMEELFAGLALAGVDRSGLQQAWGFPVASAEALAGRMLHIRDDAFDRLGDNPPEFTVDFVGGTDLPPGIGRRVVGRFDVPLYLTGDGSTGSVFQLGPDGLPVTGGATYPARFTCQIPARALEGGDPAEPVVYGHGLLGSATEANGTSVAAVAVANDDVYCATDWIGMSEQDFPTAVEILGDISNFPKLADRVQQGILNTLFLGRLLARPDGFAADPAFRTATGTPVFRTGEVFYDGNSQGGIIGAAATAVAQDWTKAVLGVPGMNYSLLLNRSTDFDLYSTFLRQAYPRPDRPADHLRGPPDALGPGRGQRVRPAHHDRPLPGHAGQAGAPARRLRRLPGPPGLGRDHGQGLRCPPAGSGAGTGTAPRHRTVLRTGAGRILADDGLGARLLGLGDRPTAREQHHPQGVAGVDRSVCVGARGSSRRRRGVR